MTFFVLGVNSFSFCITSCSIAIQERVYLKENVTAWYDVQIGQNHNLL